MAPGGGGTRGCASGARGWVLGAGLCAPCCSPAPSGFAEGFFLKGFPAEGFALARSWFCSCLLGKMRHGAGRGLAQGVCPPGGARLHLPGGFWGLVATDGRGVLQG